MYGISQTLPQPPGSAIAVNWAGDDGIVGLGCTYIVILAEAKELSDLGGALGAEALGVDNVGKAGDVGLANLDDGESEDGEIGSDDAATDGLALALTAATSTVAGVAVGEEEADTSRVHDTLLHRETLLVVAASDADDIALPLVAQAVGGDLSAHLSVPTHLVSSQTEKLQPARVCTHQRFATIPAYSGEPLEVTYALVHEDTELALIFNLNQLLRAIARVTNVELHCC